MVAQALSCATTQNGVRVYQNNSLANASPADLLLRTYDAAVIACRRGDGDKATRALVELINSLNFEYQEVAVGLFRLYNYCLGLIKSERFAEPEEILTQLRDTWAQALGASGRP